MKNRKQSLVFATSLFAIMAMIAGVCFGPTPAQPRIQSAKQSRMDHSKSPSRTSPSFLAASLRTDIILDSLLSSDVVTPIQQLSSQGSIQGSPPIEEFVLTPPDPEHNLLRTKLSIRFRQGGAQALPSNFSVKLGPQNVVLQRSDDDPNLLSTEIDFDFEAFAKQQQRRADLANQGQMVPVFQGREFVRMDKIQFVDPDQVHRAVDLHQSIQLTPQMLEGLPITIDPSRELLITDLSVVNDPTRTYDVCSGQGTPMGAWTFGKLITDVRNQGDASKMVEDWLDTWLTDQTINTFTVPNRATRMKSRILDKWPRTPGGELDLSQAPLRLLAIVNRIDLGQGQGTAGEARFIFAMVDSTCPTGVTQLMGGFTVILEYQVPTSGCNGTQAWAQQWHSLSNRVLGTPAFNRALQTITDQFALAGKGSGPNGSALAQLRTNETAIPNPNNLPIQWELREFHLGATDGELHESTIAQTPDSSFNNGPTVTAYINQFEQSILQDTDTVPVDYPDGSPFLGGAAPQNGQLVFWQGNPPPSDNDARRHFSTHTCSGCHGRETNTIFLHVAPRMPGSASTLSAFLTGSPGTLQKPGTETVTDPVSGLPNQFGDLLRREQYLSTVLGNGCNSGGVLQGLASQPLNLVH